MKAIVLLLVVLALGVVALAPTIGLAQSESPRPEPQSGDSGGEQPIKDSWITSKTKMSLVSDKRVKARRITVETLNGVVLLRGKVATAEERSAAEQVARGIDGVRSVSNMLQVVPEAQRKASDARDAALKKAISQRFDADEGLKSADVKVRVDHGVITLMGTVPDARLKARATELATRVQGVRSVRNELQPEGATAAARRQ
jgi:hyperosmotically inducible protein